MPTYLRFRVTLHGVEPVVWRRFLIRPDATFAELHDAIQAACGWQNSHLFRFDAEKPWERALAGIPDEDDPLTPDAERVFLHAHFSSHPRCLYLYDFGDGWEHEVILEGMQELPEVIERRLLGGARAFPPEDCGGLGSYEECLELLRGPKPTDPDQRERLEWLGSWDPEFFDFDTVARLFDSPRRRRPRKVGGA